MNLTLGLLEPETGQTEIDHLSTYFGLRNYGAAGRNIRQALRLTIWYFQSYVFSFNDFCAWLIWLSFFASVL